MTRRTTTKNTTTAEAPAPTLAQQLDALHARFIADIEATVGPWAKAHGRGTRPVPTDASMGLRNAIGAAADRCVVVATAKNARIPHEAPRMTLKQRERADAVRDEEKRFAHTTSMATIVNPDRLKAGLPPLPEEVAE